MANVIGEPILIVGITEEELPISSVSASSGFLLRSGSVMVIVACVAGFQSPAPGAVIVMLASLYAIIRSALSPPYLKVCCESAVAATFDRNSETPSLSNDSKIPVFGPVSTIRTSS